MNGSRYRDIPDSTEANMQICSYRFLSAIFTCTLCLGIGAGAAGAQVVEFNDTSFPNKATHIRALTVGGAVYDVEFLQLTIPADTDLYGPWPGTFTFDNATDAEAAVVAVNAALNGSLTPATSIGEPGGPGTTQVYGIGYESFELGQTQQCRMWRGVYDPPWGNGASDATFYNTDGRPWAKFSSSLVPVDKTTWGAIKALYPN